MAIKLDKEELRKELIELYEAFIKNTYNPVIIRRMIEIDKDYLRNYKQFTIKYKDICKPILEI